MDKSLTVLSESSYDLGQIVVELPSDLDVGYDLLILQVAVFQFLEGLFSLLSRRIALPGLGEVPIRLAHLSCDLILFILFLFKHLEVRVVEMEPLFEQVLELAGFNGLHGEFALQTSSLLEQCLI